MRRRSSLPPALGLPPGLLRILAVAVVLVVGCDRPQTLVLCHNGNCAGTADPAHDDTLEALSASLALRWRGRPVIDGVEIDSLWHRPTQTCLFDHGPGTELPPDTTAQAVAVIAEHLALPDVAANGDRFYVIIELKGYVAGRFDLHTADELVLHANCVLDMYEGLVAAAGGRHPLQITFESSSPRVLEAVVANPRWPGRLDGDVEVRLAAEAGTLWDAALGMFASVGAYDVPLDTIEYLPGWTNDAQFEVYASLGLDLCMWSYTTTPEALRSITQHEPHYVLTSEALALRRWLGE